MALFESKESKEEKKARKIAEAEQKQAEKDFALLQKYGLTGLQDPEDIQSVQLTPEEIAVVTEEINEAANMLIDDDDDDITESDSLTVMEHIVMGLAIVLGLAIVQLLMVIFTMI